MTDAWDTDLGRWALAWRDYRRGVANPAPASSSPVVESADEAFAREIALARKVADPNGFMSWLAAGPDIEGGALAGSDAKYQQMLAEEVCDDAVAADAATAFAPDVPLPFGGEEK